MGNSSDDTGLLSSYNVYRPGEITSRGLSNGSIPNLNYGHNFSSQCCLHLQRVCMSSFVCLIVSQCLCIYLSDCFPVSVCLGDGLSTCFCLSALTVSCSCLIVCLYLTEGLIFLSVRRRFLFCFQYTGKVKCTIQWTQSVEQV